MRKKGLNPISIIVMIVFVILALVVAILVSTQTGIANSRWHMFVFWAIFIGISCPGAFISGKFFNK